MMQKNRIVVILGILVLLATAATAASYNVQTAKARSTGTSNLGQNIVFTTSNWNTALP
jgi:predicted S18 family serine protease